MPGRCDHGVPTFDDPLAGLRAYDTSGGLHRSRASRASAATAGAASVGVGAACRGAVEPSGTDEGVEASGGGAEAAEGGSWTVQYCARMLAMPRCK